MKWLIFTEKHGEHSKMSWECSSIYKTTQNNREGKMKKLIKTSISLFAVFALMITFSLQQVTAQKKLDGKYNLLLILVGLH